MAIKKDEARFTIKFNSRYPHHSEAIRILNEKGRGMSSLIANALCRYANYEENVDSDITGDVKQKANYVISQDNGLDKSSSTIVPKEAALSQKNFHDTINNALEAFF